MSLKRRREEAEADSEDVDALFQRLLAEEKGVEVVDEDDSEGEPRAKRMRIEKLAPGVIALRDYLSPAEQVDLATASFSAGLLSPRNKCANEKTTGVHMLTLGKEERGSGKHKIRRPIPAQFVAHGEEVATAATAATSTSQVPRLGKPDVAVVNFYDPTAVLGLHVDRKSKVAHGSPVVSLSLGLPATFKYARNWKAELRTTVLRSGDALLFGGKSRGLVHGVEKIHDNDDEGGMPEHLDSVFPQRGRICVTLRRF